ncbi:MAG: SPOR domain-containing protein [Deltaproteobacteria bacterium]|nr:SPOR domain-containing protein [Deltaproteobacteria bacterium]
MERDRERDKRSGGWVGDEWPNSDWERGEPRPRENQPRMEDSDVRGRGRYQSGVEMEDHLPHVEDDPLYDTRPGERGSREPRGPSHGRQTERFTGRRARMGLTWGQKLMIWLGLAVASGVSFGAGLVVGASGGLDIPALPFLKSDAGDLADPDSLEAMGPAPDAEGMIEFGERGTVPARVEVPAPQAAEPVADKKPAAAPVKKALVAAVAPKAKPEAEAAKPEPAAGTADAKPAASEGQAKAEAEVPADDPSAEMTFYETATGRRAAPGLTETDEEAPAETESAEAEPVEVEAPAARAEADGSAAPVGADLLARRRAEAADGTSPASESNATPSGAALLARRQGSVSPAAPQGETYTVQVSTLSDQSEAQSLADRLSTKGYSVRVVPLSRAGMVTLYRVRVGQYPSEAAARTDLDRLKNEPGAHPYIRME